MTRFGLDHAVLAESDLEWLDVRGGSGESADFVEGCVRLRYLAINQVRGLRDLTSIGELSNLELLSLYGPPQVRSPPSLRRLESLRRMDAGSLKGIDGLGPLLDAPGLEELVLIRAISLAPSDPARIAEHPSLTTFEWYAEDVPDKVWVPVVERVNKPKARAMHAEDWFDGRA